MIEHAKIDEHQAIAALRDVVAAFGPTHIYTRPDAGDFCQYVHGREDGRLIPGCLIGQVLFTLGIPLSTLERLEGLSAGQLSMPGFIEGRGVNPLLTGRAGSVLNVAQRRQDNGNRWGLALEAAEVEYLEVTA